MSIITVKPRAFHIQHSQVAISEADAAHAEADEKWQSGVMFIAGDPAKPDATYKVADTPEVIAAIQKGRLVLVEGQSEPAKAAEETRQEAAEDVRIEPAAEETAQEVQPSSQSKRRR